MDGHRATLNSATSSASTTYSSEATSAWDDYRNVVQPAWDSYVQVASSNASWEAIRNAYISSRQTEHGARKTLDQRTADASHQYSQAIAPADQAFAKSSADAQQAYSNALSASQNTLNDKIADLTHWRAARTVSANVALEQAMVLAVKVRRKAIADAQQIRTDAEAVTGRDDAIAVANAKVTLWQANIAAKQASLAAWNAAGGTPWTAYQLALANNEAQYIASTSAIYVARATAVAGADLIRDQAISLATKIRERAPADNDWQRASDSIAAKSAYWMAPINGAQVKAHGTNAATQAASDATAAAADAGSTTGDAQKIYLTAIANIDHDYAVEIVAINGTFDNAEATASVT